MFWLLIYEQSLKELHQLMYLPWVTQSNLPAASYKYFTRLVKEYCDLFRVYRTDKQRFSICDKCAYWNSILFNPGSASAEKKMARCAKCVHLEKVRNERSWMTRYQCLGEIHPDQYLWMINDRMDSTKTNVPSLYRCVLFIL